MPTPRGTRRVLESAPAVALGQPLWSRRAQRECSRFAQSSVSQFHSRRPAAGSARGTRTGLSEGRFLHPTSAVGGGCPVPGASGGFGPPRELRGPQDWGAWAGISTFPDSKERGPNPFRVNGTACAPPARPAGRPAGTGTMRPAASQSPRPGCEWLFPDRPLPSVSSCLTRRNQQIILGISQTGEPRVMKKDGEQRGQGRTRCFFTLKIIYFMSQSLFLKTTNIQFGLA